MKKTENQDKSADAVLEQTIVPTSKPKKAGTKKIAVEKPKSEFSVSEINAMIVTLANQGHNASQIGALLRDQHHVFSVREITGKTITQILAEHQLAPESPEDLLALIRRVVQLDKHIQENKKDFTAKRGYQLTVSKIRRLVKYYRAAKRLPKDWRYSIETARLLVK